MLSLVWALNVNHLGDRLAGTTERSTGECLGRYGESPGRPKAGRPRVSALGSSVQARWHLRGPAPPLIELPPPLAAGAA